MTHPVALSPECRLVFLTAGQSNNDEAIRSIARGPVDWERVLFIAQREHAVASLWRALARTSADSIPPVVADHLRKCAMVSDFKMLHLAQRLQGVLKVFHERNIEVMLLKGAAIGASVYRSFVERPMVDVDILVRPSDTDRARDALMAAGWPQATDPVLTGLLKGHHHLAPFIASDGTALRIELHTSMLPADHPFDFSDEAVWASASRASAEFWGAMVPAPRHLLLHACVHFCWSHAMTFGAWRTFRDVSELVRASKIDWHEFERLAHETRAASACYWLFRLADRLSGTAIPPDVLRRLRAPSPEALRRALERHFITNIALGEGPPCPSARLSHQLWRIAMRPRWSGHANRGTREDKKSWEAAFGGPLPDTPSRRFVRHLTNLRAWWAFLTRTLVPLR